LGVSAEAAALLNSLTRLSRVDQPTCTTPITSA
jgi:hypothetical protein